MAAVMTDAAREARREYMRRWNAANPDKRRAIQARYWARKAQEAELQRQKTAENGRKEDSTDDN